MFTGKEKGVRKREKIGEVSYEKKIVTPIFIISLRDERISNTGRIPSVCYYCSFMSYLVLPNLSLYLVSSSRPFPHFKIHPTCPFRRNSFTVHSSRPENRLRTYTFMVFSTFCWGSRVEGRVSDQGVCR